MSKFPALQMRHFPHTVQEVFTREKYLAKVFVQQLPEGANF